MNHLIRLCLLLLLFPSTCSFAQSFVVQINQDAGLPDKYITSICKDKHGLMWIGTQSGICVYDGYEFKPLLGSNIVNKESIKKLLYDNKQDCLWVATEKGLFIIHCSSFQVERAQSGLHWRYNPVTDMEASPQGDIYVSFKSGEIVAFRNGAYLRTVLKTSNSNTKIHYPVAFKIDADTITVILNADANKYRYAISNGKLFSDRTSLSSYPAILIKDKEVDFITPNAISHIPLNIYSANRTAFINSLKTIGNISSFLLKKDREVFVISRPCTVRKIDFEKEQVEEISSDLFNNRTINTAFLDDDKILWLGSNKGLIKILFENNLFKTYLTENLPSISVRSIFKAENNKIYAGVYSGIYEFSKPAKQWKKVATQIPYSFINIPGKYYYFVEEQLQFSRMDKLSNVVEQKFYKVSAGFDNRFNRGSYLVKQANGNILIGTNSGLICYNPVSNLMSPYAISGLPENTEVRYIKLLPKNEMLLCTSNGIYKIDENQHVKTHWNTTTLPALSSNTVDFAEVDRMGVTWICTEGGGVNLLSADNKTISFLKTKDGLSDNTTYSLIFKNDRAWISTYNGLSSYNIRDKKFYNYHSNVDGISENEFNRNAMFNDSASGLMYFGSIRGITEVDVQKLPEENKTSRLFVSSISKWDNSKNDYVNIAPDISTRNQAIIIRNNDHSLVFNLGISDYSNPDKNVFRYRVKGLIEDWITIPNQHSIPLNGLGPGNYTLQIQALNSRGQLVQNLLQYQIKVRSPFVKTVWFYLLLLLVLSSIVLGFSYLRIKNIRRIATLKQQIANDLHDEVGSLLTRVTMNSDNLRYVEHSKEDSHVKLAKISALSRYAAFSMNDILWTINAKNNFTVNLADRIREHAEEMLNADQTDIIFDIQVTENQVISSDNRQAVYVIFKEAIRNVMAHSQPKAVHIIFNCRKGYLYLEVSNDGLLNPDPNFVLKKGLSDAKNHAHKLHAALDLKKEKDTFTLILHRG